MDALKAAEIKSWGACFWVGIGTRWPETENRMKKELEKLKKQGVGRKGKPASNEKCKITRWERLRISQGVRELARFGG